MKKRRRCWKRVSLSSQKWKCSKYTVGQEVRWITPATDAAVLARHVYKPEMAAKVQGQIVMVLDVGVMV